MGKQSGGMGGEIGAVLPLSSCALGPWVRWEAGEGLGAAASVSLGLIGLCPLCSQPKGADRKQKTDREKMEKRTAQEKEKYQPSYETTILTEVSRLGAGTEPPRAFHQERGCWLRFLENGPSRLSASEGAYSAVVGSSVWSSCPSDKTQWPGRHFRNNFQPCSL